MLLSFPRLNDDNLRKITPSINYANSSNINPLWVAVATTKMGREKLLTRANKMKILPTPADGKAAMFHGFSAPGGSVGRRWNNNPIEILVYSCEFFNVRRKKSWTRLKGIFGWGFVAKSTSRAESILSAFLHYLCQFGSEISGPLLSEASDYTSFSRLEKLNLLPKKIPFFRNSFPLPSFRVPFN